VRDLAPGVDPGVGAAGDGQRGLGREGQGPAERLLDDLLDGPQSRLAAPAMKG
jgi:hypothetical protein